MKKNVIIFCVFAALAMLFAGCKGGGGGDSKDSTTTNANAAGVWSDGTDVGGYYTGMYFADGKIYLAATKDKTTFYYNSENAAGTYTTNGNEVTINITGSTSGTAIINGDTMTDKSDPNNILKRYASAKIEGKSATDFSRLIMTWAPTPPSP